MIAAVNGVKEKSRLSHLRKPHATSKKEMLSKEQNLLNGELREQRAVYCCNVVYDGLQKVRRLI